MMLGRPNCVGERVFCGGSFVDRCQHFARRHALDDSPLWGRRCSHRDAYESARFYHSPSTEESAQFNFSQRERLKQ